MTKRINRGRLPIPDSRGYVRPEVGGQRFIVGNIKEVGTSEMERRLADLRSLFERRGFESLVTTINNLLRPVRNSRAR